MMLEVRPGELSELIVALDHRLAEAEAGNAYAWWPQCGALYLRLLELGGGESTLEREIRGRLAALEARA